MKTKTVNVSPELASIWLKQNKNNRPISHLWVDALAQYMKDGEWQLTHQGIAFSGNEGDSGELLDGQHRLMAVIKSGVTIPLTVTFGQQSKTFTVLDDSRPRSFGVRNKWDKDVTTVCHAIHGIVTNGGSRMSVLQAKAYRDSELGKNAVRLLHGCPTKRKSLSTVRVILGAALAMLNKSEPMKEAIVAAYRAMILGDVGKMPVSVAAAFSAFIQMEANGRSSRIRQLSTSYKAFSNFSAKRVLSISAEVEDMVRDSQK